MAKETSTTPISEETVGLNFKISKEVNLEIKMTQLNQQAKGTKVELNTMYPELIELGLAAYKKKYKL